MTQTVQQSGGELYVGGPVEPVVALFSFFGIIYTINLQWEDLSLQRKELSLTREELAGQREQLK